MSVHVGRPRIAKKACSPTLFGMTLPRMSRTVVLLVLSLAFAAEVPSAAAQGKVKKPAPACGIRYLPLAVGTTFEYGYVPGLSPSRRETEPTLPDKLTIEVTKVEPWVKDGKPVAGGSRIVLTEKFRNVSKETEIFCSGAGLVVDPHSFFYTGEAGGGLNMDLSEMQRSTETTWPKSLAVGTAWREDVSAKVTRRPSEGSNLKKLTDAKIEIEREAKVDGTEDLVVNGIEHKKAARVLVKITGRAYGESAKPVSLQPEDAETTYWFKDDVGLVRVENRYMQNWQLNDTTYAGQTPTPPATSPAPPTTPPPAPAKP